jgi:uncharacterized heparinase superfamily protein
MTSLARTFRTIRYLRVSQVYWRLRYRRQRAMPARVITLPRTIVTRSDFPDVPLAAHPQRHDEEDIVAQLARGEFRLLNETRNLGRDEIDWQLGEKSAGRLWTVSLHYHAWAFELARRVRDQGPSARQAGVLLGRYLGDWITGCDLTVAGSRELAWNAYAIATRIGWWCRLYHLLGREGRHDWGSLETVFLESLWSQAAFLEEHIEYDLRANHLLRDAVGLAWAGRFFAGPRSKRWLAAARRIALEQLDEQVLADGGHFERSPMYHVEVMNDFLALAILLEDKAVRQRMRKVWSHMAEFLAWSRHPDGQVPLFNDGGFNGAPEPEAMFVAGRRAFGQATDPAPRHGGNLFPDFGLAVWHGAPWSVFMDVGQVGVDYQPGHAHADTLTIEASYLGQRLFVDPGTFSYDNDERRRYDRATASHNTVAIDETDSSEVWHIFRVGRRARPRDVRATWEADGGMVSATHTGYDHLAGRPRHRRTVEVRDHGTLTITDAFEGGGRHQVAGGLLVEPSWQVRSCPGGWELTREGRSLRVSFEAEGGKVLLSTEQAAYHPEYGLEQTTRRLVWRGVLDFPCRSVIRVQPAQSE